MENFDVLSFLYVVNITDIGRHTLQFRTILSDTNPLKSLPSVDIPFFVTEADPSKLIVGLLETPLKVGVPFQVIHCPAFLFFEGRQGTTK